MENITDNSLPIIKEQGVKTGRQKFLPVYLRLVDDQIREKSGGNIRLAHLPAYALMSLGSIPLLETGHFTLGTFVGISGLSGTALLAKTGYDTLRDIFAMEKRIYPDIREKGITLERLREKITDGVRGFYSSFYIHSLLSYKKQLIKFAAQELPIQEEGLWSIMLETPDLNLKFHILEIIRKRGPKTTLIEKMVSNLKSSPNNSFEKAASAWLASQWNLPEIQEKSPQTLPSLENFRLKKIFESASNYSNEIISRNANRLPNTLKPLVKLFILRKFLEDAGRNLLPQNTTQLEEELFNYLHHFNVLRHESEFAPENPTIGIEMQPQAINTEVYPLRVNMNDIREIIKYAGLGDSPDIPFEFVLPPTFSPYSQILIVSEILRLTGIPIVEAGIQLNFGGITNKRTARALQRIILAASRMKPSWLLIQQEQKAYWALPTEKKGEVNIRNKDEIVKIATSKTGEEEIDSVAEMRAPVGAVSFFVFARGLIQAYEIAKLAKAHDKRINSQTNDLEAKMAQKFDRICNSLNKILKRHNLPQIHERWTGKDWVCFTNLATDQKSSVWFVNILKAHLKR